MKILGLMAFLSISIFAPAHAVGQTLATGALAGKVTVDNSPLPDGLVIVYGLDAQNHTYTETIISKTSETGEFKVIVPMGQYAVVIYRGSDRKLLYQTKAFVSSAEVRELHVVLSTSSDCAIRISSINEMVDALRKINTPDAFYRLGCLYFVGKSVPKDYGQALIFFRQAAARGDVGAMYMIGTMYRNGYALPRDDLQALSWFRRAAEAGSPDGMFAIGSMYEEGRGGVTKDSAQALEWYTRAAKLGNRAAESKIKK